MKRIVAQIRKELVQFSRDRLTLVLALVLPVILLLLLGEATSLSVKDIPVVVQDMDKTEMSRAYIDTITSSLSFKVTSLPTNMQPDVLLEKNEARGAVIIPENFERELTRGQTVEVQWLIDATDANTANVMRGKAAAITQAFVAQIRPTGIKPPIKQELRYWFNPGREDLKYFGPGILAFGMALFPPLLAALAMSREGEQKTILQVYVSSISAFEYLVGKVVAYLIVAFAEWFCGMLLLFFVFRLSFAGDPIPLLVTTFFYLTCMVCFGAMIGAAIPNQAAAIQAVQIGGFLMAFLLSGYLFPVSNIPMPLRFLSNFVPMRYYLDVIRDAFVRGGGWAAVWHAPIALALLGTFFFLRAWRVLKPMQIKA